MFDFLKKKISNFVEKLTGKAEEKAGQKAEEKIEEKPAEKTAGETIAEKPVETPAEIPPAVHGPEKKIEPEPGQKFEAEVEPKPAPTAEQKLEKKPEPKIGQKIPLPKVETKQEIKPQPKHEPKIEPKAEQRIEPKQEKTFAPQLSVFKKVASIFTPEVELSEKELAEVFDDLELSLLESDASLDTSQFMVSDLRAKVVGKRVAKSKLNEFVNSTVRSVLLDVFSLSSPSQSFFSLVEQHRNSAKTPFVILFVGPNGAGKTTTIAKLCHHLKERNVSCVISASDTFRAAAIQQAEHHGEKLGVKVVKHDYGSDPAAVAFDAVSHAKAKNLDVVLIDTAGRQETNVNLIEEMKKISRVVTPDLKIFIGETLAGHSVIEQAKKFNEAIKLDGLILTKLDCDAKGGNALSIAHDLKLPIYFVGLGQKYEELVEFNPQMLVSRILV